MAKNFVDPAPCLMAGFAGDEGPSVGMGMGDGLPKDGSGVDGEESEVVEFGLSFEVVADEEGMGVLADEDGAALDARKPFG